MRGEAHRAAIRAVLDAFGDDARHFVFVGGCVLGLYARAEGAPLRATLSLGATGAHQGSPSSSAYRFEPVFLCLIATSTIYVPAGGLVFRAADGTPIARLSRGPHGGSFELFDDRGETRAAPNNGC